MNREKKEDRLPADLIDSIYPKINKVADEGRTTSRVIEDIYLCLVRKLQYRERAFDLMYKIPVYKPSPFFEIKMTDLADDLHEELKNYEPERKDFIMRQAIGKIFANINAEYYYGSVASCLRWRFVE